MLNRSVWISGGILLCGVALTTLTATALVRSHEAVVQSQRERAAFGYAELLRNHLQNRETIARTVAATFYPPESFQPGALAPLRKRLLVLLPHINSIVWIPRISPGDIPAFLAAARIAYPTAGLMGPGRAPTPSEALKSDFYAVLDIEPSTPANLSSLGLVISSLPGPGAALEKAAALSDIVATPPLELVQLPGVLSIVAYVPLRKAGEERGPLVGYLGFSYRLDRLIGSVLNDVIGPDEGLRVRDMEAPHLGDLYRTGKSRSEKLLSLGNRL